MRVSASAVIGGAEPFGRKYVAKTALSSCWYDIRGSFAPAEEAVGRWEWGGVDLLSLWITDNEGQERATYFDVLTSALSLAAENEGQKRAMQYIV